MLSKKAWVDAGTRQLAAQGLQPAATPSAAAAASKAAGGKPPRPHLIVCPASLIENWQRELRQWCPKLRCARAGANGR